MVFDTGRYFFLSLLLECTLISTAEAGKVACQKILMDWRRAGILAEKIGRVNRANLKAPIITGQPKTQSIYEFCKDWALFKTDAGIYVNEELKAVREADKDVTNAMETEHLKERFGNPMELIHNREAEFASWKRCKGSSKFRQDWFCHAEHHRVVY